MVKRIDNPEPGSMWVVNTPDNLNSNDDDISSLNQRLGHSHGDVVIVLGTPSDEFMQDKASVGIDIAETKHTFVRCMNKSGVKHYHITWWSDAKKYGGRRLMIPIGD